ncbi:hypothetical protein E8E95_10210 [Pseudomonas sp. BN414]|uniref:acetyl-CoA carboxylase biotin carboxyl carrier protein n=1 Tax=Pseudomonas sp. BN414 TaxID=2567888 RepID=UPI002454043C|nr:biotin/lipoyl-containing protein [Pseudomonas sp. BN414]MDH4567052.1 hypothetical protein [Pseudomonas sp. BN414]
MNFETIENLVRRLEGSSIVECEYENGTSSVLLQFAPTAQAVAPCSDPSPVTPEPAALTIDSPAVGRFFARHPLDANPLVATGDRVKQGQQVGFIEVVEVLRPVNAPCDGWLGAAQLADGALAGYGTALFALVPAES